MADGVAVLADVAVGHHKRPSRGGAVERETGTQRGAICDAVWQWTESPACARMHPTRWGAGLAVGRAVHGPAHAASRAMHVHATSGAAHAACGAMHVLVASGAGVHVHAVQWSEAGGGREHMHVHPSGSRGHVHMHPSGSRGHVHVHPSGSRGHVHVHPSGG